MVLPETDVAVVLPVPAVCVEVEEVVDREEYLDALKLVEVVVDIGREVADPNC